MDYNIVAAFQNHLNGTVEYRIELNCCYQCMRISERTYRGILREVKDQKGKYFALINRKLRLDDGYHREKGYDGQEIIDKVPLVHIKLTNPDPPSQVPEEGPSAAGDRAESTPWNTASSSLTYKHVRYEIATIGKLKIGDQVVWNAQNPFPMIGTVNWIGVHCEDGGPAEVIAVVNFNQPTEHLPGYLQGPPNNRNVVNINDLLLLKQGAEAADQNIQIPSTDFNDNMAGDYLPEAHSNKLESHAISTNDASYTGHDGEGSNGSNILQYGDDKYIGATVDEMIEGDDVVWNNECETKNTLIGKIIWTGWKWEPAGDGQKEFVAVVKFDVFTNHLARPLYPLYLQKVNHNIVNISELVSLANSLKTIEKSDSERRSSEITEDESCIQLHGEQSSASVNPAVSATISVADTKSGTTNILVPMSNENVVDEEQNVEEKENNAPLNLRRDKRSSPSSGAGSKDDTKKFKTQTASERADAFYLTVQSTPKPNHKFGIQGLNNSCYMDASIFALFAFNKSLDNVVCPADKSDQRKESAESAVRRRLVSIIKELRKHYFVSNKRMKKLRNELVERKGPQYEYSYMDAEEFMIDLFKLLGIPELFTYDYGGHDYIHQIILAMTWDESQKKNYVNLQVLLEESFATYEVKLSEMPKSTFIIKLPVSDGKLIPCDGVIPNVLLDLSKIVDTKAHCTTMRLQAVVCLRSCHFVSFVCLNNTDDSSRWVFMDSQPMTAEPKEMSRNIKVAEAEIEGQQLSKHEPACGGYKLFRDAYMCVYMPT